MVIFLDYLCDTLDYTMSLYCYIFFPSLGNLVKAFLEGNIHCFILLAYPSLLIHQYATTSYPTPC